MRLRCVFGRENKVDIFWLILVVLVLRETGGLGLREFRPMHLEQKTIA